MFLTCALFASAVIVRSGHDAETGTKKAAAAGLLEQADAEQVVRSEDRIMERVGDAMEVAGGPKSNRTDLCVVCANTRQLPRLFRFAGDDLSKAKCGWPNRAYRCAYGRENGLSELPTFEYKDYQGQSPVLLRLRRRAYEQLIAAPSGPTSSSRKKVSTGNCEAVWLRDEDKCNAKPNDREDEDCACLREANKIVGKRVTLADREGRYKSQHYSEEGPNRGPRVNDGYRSGSGQRHGSAGGISGGLWYGGGLRGQLLANHNYHQAMFG